MKNLAKLFGLTVLAVVIGLSVTACSTDGDDDGTPVSSAPLGETLTLSGQVYRDMTFTPIQGNLSVSSGGIGGNGSVTGGQLSFTIGTPTALESIKELMGGAGESPINVQISPADAQGAMFSYLEITGSNEYNILMRFFETSQTSGTRTQETVSYIYVDRDVTMVWTSGSMGNGAYTWSGTNMSLKKGWNARYSKIVQTYTQNRGSEHTSVSAADPSHIRWVAMNAIW